MFPDRRHRPGYAIAFAVVAKGLLFPIGVVIATVTLLVFACIGVVHAIRLIRWKVFGGTRPVLHHPEAEGSAT
jgi:hypothetical protein